MYARDAIYMTKQLPTGEREAYSRGYGFLRLLTEDEYKKLKEEHEVISTWPDYTGGRSEVRGDALWWSE